MQYRIIERTYEDGTTKYCPQYKWMWFWVSFNYIIDFIIRKPYFYDSKDRAMYDIRKHKSKMEDIKKRNMKYSEKVLDDNII